MGTSLPASAGKPAGMRAAIYCRLSSPPKRDNADKGEDGDRGDDATGLQTQLDRCVTYAAKHGYSVVMAEQEIYTGILLRERPKLGAIRKAVRDGKVDVVLAYSIDRLSRSQAHLSILADEAKTYGARLEFVTESFDDSSIGVFIRSAKAFAAEVEREKITERIGRRLLARVEKEGLRLNGSKPPYGLKYADADDRQDLIPNETEAPIVVRMFHEVANGGSARKLANALSSEGVPTPQGASNRWRSTSIIKILRNPIYTGRAVAYRTKLVRQQGTKRATGERGETEKYVDRPQEEWIEAVNVRVTPLIDPQTFAKVQHQLASNRTNNHHRAANPEAFLLRAGIARCGYCGRPLSCQTRHKANGRSSRCYLCPSVNRDQFGCPAYAIAPEILDRAVWWHVAGVLTDPEYVRNYIADSLAKDTSELELATIESGLKAVAKEQTRLTRLAMMLADDEDAAAPIEIGLRDQAAKKRALQVEREAVLSRRVNWSKALADWDKLVWAFAADPEGQLGAFRERLSYADRRHWLATLGVTVKVWATGHDPRYEITMAVDPLYWVPTEEDIRTDALPEDEWLPSTTALPLKPSGPAIAASPLSTSHIGSG